MCSSCWIEHGSPTVWNPAVVEVWEMICTLYNDGPNGIFGETSGGPLHVALDDWNLDGETIEPYYVGDEPEDLRCFCDILAAKLTVLTVPERYSAVAHFDGLASDGVPLEGLL